MISIGRFSKLAKRAIHRHPTHLPFEVWITPSIPSWDYTPVGPYRLIRSEITVADIYAYEDHTSLGKAVVSFAELHLPRAGEVCVLLDERSQIILGWFQEPDGMRWGGCQHGFRLLEACHVNPVDVAFWEANAKAAHDRLLFKKVGLHES